MSKKQLRTVILAIVALGAFIYSAVAIFDVPLQEMITFGLVAIILVGGAMVMAALVVSIRWLIKKVIQKDDHH